MALSISEREATRILIRERLRRGTDEGLQTFARTVLGAHSEQAKHLAYMAGFATEASLVEMTFGDEETTEPEFSVVGDTLKLSHNGYEPLDAEALAVLYKIDLTVWRPDYQTLGFQETASGDKYKLFAKFKYDERAAARQHDREAYRQWAAETAPILPVPQYDLETNPKNLLEIMIPDLHAGKFIEDRYDVDKALTRLKEGVIKILSRGLVDGIGRIDFVYNGDTFNDDSSLQLTFAGTPQQSAGRRSATFRKVRSLIAELAATACQFVPEVNVWILPGNHDRDTALNLADSLWSYFAHTPQVTVNIEPKEMEFIEWGINLIGLTHGDGAKSMDLAMNLLREGNTQGKKYFEVHKGHLHTESLSEHHGVFVRGFGSPADNGDDWHTRKFYTHARQSMCGIVWNEENGKVSTHYVNFNG